MWSVRYFYTSWTSSTLSIASANSQIITPLFISTLESKVPMRESRWVVVLDHIWNFAENSSWWTKWWKWRIQNCIYILFRKIWRQRFMPSHVSFTIMVLMSCINNSTEFEYHLSTWKSRFFTDLIESEIITLVIYLFCIFEGFCTFYINIKYWMRIACLSFSACTPPLDEIVKLWDFLFAFGPHVNIVCLVAQVVIMRDEVLSAERYRDIRHFFVRPNFQFLTAVMSVETRHDDILLRKFMKFPPKSNNPQQTQLEKSSSSWIEYDHISGRANRQADTGWVVEETRDTHVEDEEEFQEIQHTSKELWEGRERAERPSFWWAVLNKVFGGLYKILSPFPWYFKTPNDSKLAEIGGN